MTASALMSKRIAYFVEMGAGKTKATLEFINETLRKINEIFESEKSDKHLLAFVAAPTEAVYVWKEQSEEYIPDMKVYIIESGLTPKKRKEIINSVKYSLKPGKKSIVIINYDSVRVAVDSLLGLNPLIAIADESHLLKNIKAARSKAFYQIAKNTDYRIILTGTPILNSPSDAFGQIYILDDGATFGSSEIAFRRRYYWDAASIEDTVDMILKYGKQEVYQMGDEDFRKKYWRTAKGQLMMGRKTIVDWPILMLRPGAIEEIKEKIASISVQYKKSECMDLPEKVYAKPVYIKLSKEQKEMYKSISEDNMAELGDQILLTSHVLQKICKLRQITSGFINIDDVITGKVITNEFKDQPKLDALKSIFEGIRTDQKIIVWTCYRRDCEMIYNTFKKMEENPAKIIGGMGLEDRANEVKKFQTDDSCRVIVLTVQAGGRAISLTAASYAIYYSNDYSLEHRLQSEDRPHRPGLKNPITIIDLVAKNTIDVVIQKALRNKKSMADTLIGLKNFIGGME